MDVMFAGPTGKLGRAVPLGAPTGRLGAATGAAGRPARLRLGLAVKMRTTVWGGVGRLLVALATAATGAGALGAGTGRAEATQPAISTGEGAWRNSMEGIGCTTPVLSSKANTWVILAGASPFVEFQHGWAMSMEGADPVPLPAGDVE